MGFVDPSTLTNEEILEDIEAGKSILSDISDSERVPLSHKREIEKHVDDLIQEYEKRTKDK